MEGPQGMKGDPGESGPPGGPGKNGGPVSIPFFFLIRRFYVRLNLVKEHGNKCILSKVKLTQFHHHASGRRNFKSHVQSTSKVARAREYYRKKCHFIL